MERGGTGTQKQKESINYIPFMGFEDNTGKRIYMKTY